VTPAGHTFPRYWAGRLASYAGDQVARTALLIVVYDRYGAGAIGLFLTASSLPRLFGVVLGALADRFDQRRLMVGCDLVQAAIYLVLAVTLPPFPALLCLAALAATGATVFVPAGRSLLPRMVPADLLTAANARLAVARNLGIAAGPALGGLLLAGCGLRVTLLVNVATFTLSALLVGLPGFTVAPTATETAKPEPFRAVLRSGLSVVHGDRVVRIVCVLLLVTVVFAAMDNVAVVPLGLGVLHAGTARVGLFGTGYGAGMVLAPMLLVLRGRFRADWVLHASLLAFGAGTLMTGAAPGFVLALVGQVLAGAGNGWFNVATDTLVQQHVPAAHLGTVFGTVYTFPYAAEVLAYAAGGPLLAAAGARSVLLIAGAGVLAAAVVGFITLVRAITAVAVSPKRSVLANAPTGPLPQLGVAPSH
jgi:MFS family permease